MFFLIIIYLTFISLGLPDSLLGTTWPLMRLDLGMPIEAAGIISFIISGGTIVASFFSDKIIKRFKTGNVTFVSVLLTALALLGFSLATEFYMLVILAIPLGLGAGAIDSGLNKYVADNYDAKHMNWLHSFWGLGAIIGPLLISLFIGLQNGWRLGYLVISLAQFSIVLLLFTTLKKWQAKENGKDESIELNNGDFKKIGKKAMFAIFSSYFIYMLIESAIILWGATYLIEARRFGESSAALTISIFFIGMTSGRMISGFLSKRFGNNTLIKLGIGLIVIGITILFIPNSITSIIGIVVIGLGLAPIYPALLHQTPVYFGKENSQKMMGRQMAFAYTSSTFMPPLLGFILSKTSFNLLPYILIGVALIFVAGTFFYPKVQNNINYKNR